MTSLSISANDTEIVHPYMARSSPASLNSVFTRHDLCRHMAPAIPCGHAGWLGPLRCRRRVYGTCWTMFRSMRERSQKTGDRHGAVQGESGNAVAVERLTCVQTDKEISAGFCVPQSYEVFRLSDSRKSRRYLCFRGHEKAQDRLGIRHSGDQGGGLILAGWTPTPEDINALPEVAHEVIEPA
jgi:hypothetical protein